LTTPEEFSFATEERILRKKMQRGELDAEPEEQPAKHSQSVSGERELTVPQPFHFTLDERFKAISKEREKQEAKEFVSLYDLSRMFETKTPARFKKEPEPFVMEAPKGNTVPEEFHFNTEDRAAFRG
jgi:hypothetical protein